LEPPPTGFWQVWTITTWPSLFFYDSLATSTTSFKEKSVLFINLISQKCNFTLPSTNWTFQKLHAPTPGNSSEIISEESPILRVHQETVVDCGVFCCSYAYHIVTKKNIQFQQNAIQNIRFKMTLPPIELKGMLAAYVLYLHKTLNGKRNIIHQQGNSGTSIFVYLHYLTMINFILFSFSLYFQSNGDLPSYIPAIFLSLFFLLAIIWVRPPLCFVRKANGLWNFPLVRSCLQLIFGLHVMSIILYAIRLRNDNSFEWTLVFIPIYIGWAHLQLVRAGCIMRHGKSADQRFFFGASSAIDALGIFSLLLNLQKEGLSTLYSYIFIPIYCIELICLYIVMKMSYYKTKDPNLDFIRAFISLRGRMNYEIEFQNRLAWRRGRNFGGMTD